MNYSEYWKEVNDTATNIIDIAKWGCECDTVGDDNKEEIEEFINDSLLHETIDGHQWIIYYSYNLDIIKYSDNEEYMVDNFGDDSIAYTLKENGLHGLHQVIAFWAFYADVQGAIQDKLEEM